MKKALSLFGILCLLLAFVIPIFAGPMSIVATPFWDSTPYSVTNPITGGDPGENPVRVAHWEPLESFIVQSSYELSVIEIYAQMCNYLPDELASMSFPKAELRALLLNWTPADGGGFKRPAANIIGIYSYDINSEITQPEYISLDTMWDPLPKVEPNATVTYSISFILMGDGVDYYDICLFRSLSDDLSGRGYIYSADWNPMPTGEGNDIAMRLYGTQVTPDPPDPLEPDCDGDGIPDDIDDDDNNDCKGDDENDKIEDRITTIPVITAFLFALGGILLLLGMSIVPLGGWGWVGVLVMFIILFALWYFWLIWAWLGVFV